MHFFWFLTSEYPSGQVHYGGFSRISLQVIQFEGKFAQSMH